MHFYVVALNSHKKKILTHQEHRDVRKKIQKPSQKQKKDEQTIESVNETMEFDFS